MLENIRTSSAAASRAGAREEKELPPVKHKSGTVPKYLKARQRQWRDEAQAVIDSTPDADCPAGHVKLGRGLCLIVYIITRAPHERFELIGVFMNLV